MQRPLLIYNSCFSVAALGIPAVGHLSSEIWMALKMLSVRTPIRGFGKLLAML
jgi:maleate cis-trans isomerase